VEGPVILNFVVNLINHFISITLHRKRFLHIWTLQDRYWDSGHNTNRSYQNL